jgi:hypothetical protein
MKTDDLIAMLATGVQPVPRHAAARRLALALLPGVAIALLLVMTVFGPRADLLQAMAGAGFWWKMALPLSLAAAGFVLAQRLARPGVRAGAAVGLALVPVLMLWAVALLVLWRAPEGTRAALVMGSTWRSCALNIGLLALPSFVAALAALRTLAPTRPAAAGAAAGLLAAGVGAAVYALHCPEVEAPFLAVWYVGGMALPVLAGAALAHRLLRW